MSEFKRGQLVAVSSGTLVNRRIRIFCGYYKAFDGEIMYLCREAGESEKDAVAWPRCVPLEEVEPGAFIDWERSAGEQASLKAVKDDKYE